VAHPDIHKEYEIKDIHVTPRGCRPIYHFHSSCALAAVRQHKNDSSSSAAGMQDLRCPELK